MYFIPQPMKVEYKDSGEEQKSFVLSYRSYLVLDPSCGEKLT